MYGMVGKLVAQGGKRGQMVAILQRAADVVGQMPGCHLYLVNEDVADDVTLWVYEAWDDKAAHDLSLQDPQVRALIAEAMPMMGGPPSGSELRVMGGYGLS